MTGALNTCQLALSLTYAATETSTSTERDCRCELGHPTWSCWAACPTGRAQVMSQVIEDHDQRQDADTPRRTPSTTVAAALADTPRRAAAPRGTGARRL